MAKLTRERGSRPESWPGREAVDAEAGRRGRKSTGKDGLGGSRQRSWLGRLSTTKLVGDAVDGKTSWGGSQGWGGRRSTGTAGWGGRQSRRISWPERGTVDGQTCWGGRKAVETAKTSRRKRLSTAKLATGGDVA